MKSKNHLSFVFFSLFLLLLSLSLLSYQLFKVPKEVEAVVGILDLYAQTTSSLNTPGGIWDSLGNVGIGTTAPTLKLTVGGGKIGLDGGQQIIFSDVDTTNNLKLQLWSGYGLGINGSTLFYTANGNHSWRDGGGTNERMLLTTAANGGLTVKGTGNTSFAGNVGIGTTTPSYKFQVAGTVYASGSSKRFKQNITDIKVNSEKIYDLRPVSFDYKTQYKSYGKQLGGGRQIGLIAEEVYKVIPELSIKLNNEISNVDYEKLSILLLVESKKQKKEINSLKLEIKNLEQRLILVESKLK